MTERLTIDQLGEKVAEALSVDYAGPKNGQIRSIPDRRTIRYYTSLGLIDRPAQMKGRTALYAQRHLLQLVAIKRLQAQGLSLTEVQKRLAGASNAQLERVARLPEVPEDQPAPQPPAQENVREDFWRTPESIAEAEAHESQHTHHAPLMTGIPLDPVGALTLLLTPARAVLPQDLSALQEAATPLIEALRSRGLLNHPEED